MIIVMGFDTISFWVVFFFLALLHRILIKKVFRNALLLIASYAIYGAWDVRFLPLILISTLVDFSAGHWAGPDNTPWQRRTALAFSLTVNLGLLCTFKYLLEIWGSNGLPDMLVEIGLPLGISFYTFQTLSYTLDIYRGRMAHTRNLMDFALYVSFFPQLTAGPIEKARRLLPQISADRTVTWEDMKEGLALIMLGLFKKIYVADSLATAIDFVFEEENPETPLVLFASILMTFRVYADFSGYSNMARGTARFFGIKLIQNFRPFFTATSPQVFWRSWHISFMEWVRDYLILPFHNRKRSEWITSTHIFFTLIIVGLWHKASINWLLFGLLHGSALVATRQWNIFCKKYRFLLPNLIRVGFGLCFMMTLYFFSGLFHRSEDIEQTLSLLSSLNFFEGWHREPVDFLLYALQFLGPLLVYESFIILKKDEFFILKCPLILRAFAMAVALSFIVLFERVGESRFIYFNF